MAGAINNPTILKGLNQLIKAINDLATCLCGQTATGQTNTNGGDEMTSSCCCIPGSNFGQIPGLPPVGPSIPPPALPGVPDPIDPETDPPPEGFTDWDQFYLNKCQVANKIIDDLISSLHNLAGLEGLISGIAAGSLFLFLNTSLLSGLLVGLIAFGFAAFDAAAIVIGAIILIAFAGLGGLAFFEVLANDIDKQQLVCDIYNGHTPQEIYNALKADLTTEIGGLPDITDLVSDQIVKLILACLNTSVTNMPFELHPELLGYISPDPIDCAVCGSFEPSAPICNLFEEDGNLEGWTAGAGRTDFPTDGTMVADGGEMQGTAGDGGDGSFYLGFLSPSYDYVIQEGDIFCFTKSFIDVSSYSSYIWAAFDGGEIDQIQSAAGIESTGVISVDLSPYVGQTLNRIWFGWVRASLTFDVHATSAGLNCPDCVD